MFRTQIETAIVRLQLKYDHPVNVGRLWGNFNKRMPRSDFDRVLAALVAGGYYPIPSPVSLVHFGSSSRRASVSLVSMPSNAMLTV